MIFEQIINLIGKPLNDAILQAFMLEHGFKPAKKAEISNRTSETTFWIEHKKLGVNLLFNININNPLYPPQVGSKKGMFIPILSYVTFLSKNITYPLGLTMGLKMAQVTQLLGEFTTKSSDVSKSWLNDDGSESWYSWNKTINETKQIELHARIKPDNKLDELNVSVIEYKTIFQLFNGLNSENISQFLANVNDFNDTSIFMEWGIKHGLYVGQTTEQAGVTAVKNGLPIVDFFQQYVTASGIYLEFFAPPHQQFVRQYINNMSSHDVYFGRDYRLSFLINKAERNNYLGADAQSTLAKVVLNDENKVKMFAVLDARFAEFNAHGFAKSVVELKP